MAEDGAYTMHLVQLLIPTQNESGQPYPRELFDALAQQLTNQFGGVTAYARAPATGLWVASSGEPVRDQVVVYEVMVEDVDEAWWIRMRHDLEGRFAQRELVIRTHEIRRL
jgi:hypothetical protein